MYNFRRAVYITVVLSCVAITSGMADSITLSDVISGTAEDYGPQDGVFDVLDPPYLWPGSVNNNGYTSIRTAFEFSQVDIPAASMVDSAFLALYLNNWEGNRKIEIHGFAGDGIIELADFSTDNLLGSTMVGAGSSLLTFDVTEFVRFLWSSNAPFPGFSVREAPPNPANYTIMNVTLNPKLEVNFTPPPPPIPEPSILTLLYIGVLGAVACAGWSRTKR